MPGKSAPAHILVVEDDVVVREIVTASLRQEGFGVAEAASCAEAERQFHAEPVHLVVADVNLPDGTGFDLAHTLRQRQDIAVIYMTARGSAEDRIHGLESGADDYMIKPIDVGELGARVRAVLRRYRRAIAPSNAPPPVIDASGWTLDLVRRELADRQGRVISLTRAEFDLLAALIQTRTTLTRDYLMEVVSSSLTSTSLRTVDVLVSRIRRKLSVGLPPTPQIVTVPSEGYRLVLETK